MLKLTSEPIQPTSVLSAEYPPMESLVVRFVFQAYFPDPGCSSGDPMYILDFTVGLRLPDVLVFSCRTLCAILS